LPEEPTKETEDSLELIFRMPESGDRIQRRFMKTDTVQIVYDFIDDLQDKGTCKFEGIETYTDKYQIIQTRPKVEYDDKTKTLEDVGFFPRGAMLVV